MMSLTSVLLTLHALIVVMFTLRILVRNDLTPPARLAWFMVLTAAPYLGAVIYFLFGEIDLGHKADARHAAVFAELRARGGARLGDPGATADLISARFRPAFRYAASINGFHAVPGNAAELMPDHATTLARMIADIDAATDYVHVLYYIWLDDSTGRALAQALIRAAGRGVTCRAMADGLGSRALLRSAVWREMAEAGVETAIALPLDRPLTTLLRSRIDLRNHRKITVVDGRITWCGSQNSADPEFLVKAKYAPWVDIMVRFTGPVVAQNQLLFASDWSMTNGQPLIDPPTPAAPVEGGFPALVMGDGPTERRGATPALFALLIGAALEEVVLSTPYFVPDPGVLAALEAAAHRGVTVRLIFPHRNDSRIVAAASRSYYATLLEAGCEVVEYTGGLLHAKTLTVDGRVSLIGSSNLDLRSFDLNYENNLLLEDTALTSAIRARQQEYEDGSVTITRAQVAAWPVWRKIWNNAIATIGPVL